MMEDIIAIIFGTSGLTLVGLGFSPIGRALAERIRGKSAVPGLEELRGELSEQQEGLVEEVRQLRQDMADLAERVDFAERMLARKSEVERLAPPR